MVRPELHAPRNPDARAHASPRQRLDAVAWKSAQATTQAGATARPAGDDQIVGKDRPARMRAGAA